MWIERYLDALATEVIRDTLGLDQPALLRPAKEEKHGDYQVNAAMALAKKLKKSLPGWEGLSVDSCQLSTRTFWHSQTLRLYRI